MNIMEQYNKREMAKVIKMAKGEIQTDVWNWLTGAMDVNKPLRQQIREMACKFEQEFMPEQERRGAEWAEAYKAEFKKLIQEKKDKW